MRTALRALGDGLCEQLSEEGSDPHLDQAFHYENCRTWTDRRGALEIDPSTYHCEARLEGDEGVADARLVRKKVEFTILEREQQIRNLYHNILADVAGRRAAAKQQSTSAASSIEPSSATA